MAPWSERWTTGTLDANTPVCRLGDRVKAGRDRLILLSDQDADVLDWLVRQGDARRELQLTRDQRRRWTDSSLARVGMLTGLLLMVTNVILNVLTLAHAGR